LILQFCRENNLNATMAALQSESQVSLNSVENLDAFRQDILKGNWDSVIRSCDGLQLPMPKAIALYEQLVLELLEVQELELARGILRSTPAMLAMKQEHPERYLRLEHQCSRSGGSDSHDLFGGNKDKRREALAQDLIAEVTEVCAHTRCLFILLSSSSVFSHYFSQVPPSRLVLLIGQALKWQQVRGCFLLAHNLTFSASLQLPAPTPKTFPALKPPKSSALAPKLTPHVPCSHRTASSWSLDARTGSLRCGTPTRASCAKI